MVISLSWLRDLVKVNASAQEIADKLSVSGLEVEHLGLWESVKGGLNGFVIGQVVECAKHPNADKLSVTKVDIGNGELQPIVCGAPNVAAGQKVIVATVGTDVTVPGKGSFTIGEAKIRGEISRGMICAEDETGLGSSHDGIMVLPEDAEVGMRASEYFQIASEEIMEIGLTANRGDAASHLGVARDVAALFQTKALRPELKPAEAGTSAFKIEVENEEYCRRYVGLEIHGVKIVSSPQWMQNRLRSIGIEPKNIVVDATNYVLHELGQPLHAFDLDKLTGNHIGVRLAKDGETLQTLDKAERKLGKTDLLITDNSGPVALAGVMGGLKTAVNENSQNIFLESANFHAGFVRKTARKHQLNTDASFRFERGTDVELCAFAAHRAAELIHLAAGGKVHAVVDYYPAKYIAKKLDISLQKLADFSGANIASGEVGRILDSLGYICVLKDEDTLEISVPSWAIGMETEADIYEEILRIYGYDQIPFSGKMRASLPVFQGFANFRKQETAASFLIANGFTEVMNNSLTSNGYYGEDQVSGMVSINNPLSADMALMRGSLLPGMLHAAAYNRNRKTQNIRFFEFGRTYEKGKNGLKETETLGLLFGGNKTEESWEEKESKMDFYYGKRIAQNLLESLRVFAVEVEWQKVSNEVLGKFDLQGEFWFAAIEWPRILELADGRGGVRIQHPPKFPYMRRDLSIVVNKSVPFSDLKSIVDKEKVALLKQVKVFDVFEGKPLDDGKKAIALAFYLGQEDGTLTDEIADKTMKNLMLAFEKAGAVIRK